MGESEPTKSTVYEEMEPLEPYTTSELAERIGAARDVVRRLLDALYEGDQVEKKATGSGVIWVRDAPRYSCPNCEYEYQIRIVHPLQSALRFCPRCGSRLP